VKGIGKSVAAGGPASSGAEPVGQVVAGESRCGAHWPIPRYIAWFGEFPPVGTNIYASPPEGATAEVLADARRYRWLRDRLDTYQVNELATYPAEPEPETDALVDAAIDAALSDSAPEEKR
jgi:hypothetical protein